MLVGNKNFQSIWLDETDPSVVKVIDQKRLPFFFEIKELRSVDDIFNSINDMTVRGAPLIGAAAAFGIYFAALEITSVTNIRLHLKNAAQYLISCRPTAINLSWAVNYVLKRINDSTDNQLVSKRHFLPRWRSVKRKRRIAGKSEFMVFRLLNLSAKKRMEIP
jgi:methylthioribose-1-phosphate isomerase